MARILDAAAIIQRLATHTDVAVTRHASNVSYSGGKANTGSATTITVPWACVWPLTDRQLDRLPEGRRSEGTRNFACAMQLLVGAQGKGEADLVNLDGDGVLWEVQTAGEFDARAGYYLAVIQRPA